MLKFLILFYVICIASLNALRASSPAGINKLGQMVVAEELSTSRQGRFAYVRLQNGIQLRVNELVKNIIFYGPQMVRVNSNPGVSHMLHPSLAVVAHPANVLFQLNDSDAELTLTSDQLHLLVDKKSGALTFRRPDGSLITRERFELPSEIKEVTISDVPTYEVKQTFTLSDDESLYGLGQHIQRYMDYRGKEVTLVQSNIGIIIPMLVSTRRYGIMWDIYSKSIFRDDQEGASFWAESAPAGVDYYFVGGKDMDGVIAGYRALTGKAPMFPMSAFGLWMSKERYKTQEELINVISEFRKQRIPIDNIVQDWQYWGGDKDGTWSGMIWDKTRFPNPTGMARMLHDEFHVKLMCSIWPSVGNDTALARELDAKGLRHAPLHWISRKARIYDAYSEEGRRIYFKHIKSGLLDVGVDTLWMDGTEVEVGNACPTPQATEKEIKSLDQNEMGDYTRYLNSYSLMTTKGVYEGQRTAGNKRALTLTRSSFLGQQRYAALPWSGDIRASYQVFRDQISGGINVAMAGQPYWTQDTGGFFVGGNWRKGRETTPQYRELFARWHQFGAFNPVYRIHGTDIDREPYLLRDTDPEVFKSVMVANHLRYRLLPYIYSVAWRITKEDYTMMRGLPMDFPDDKAARNLDDQFMFGSAFLIHPVTRPMYRVSPASPGSIPSEVFQTPDRKPGVAIQYFEGRNFEKRVGASVEQKIDYTWPGPPLTVFPPGLRSNDNFSVRIESIMTMPEDGEYEIGAEADDGVRVWLDDKLAVDDWGIHPMRWRSHNSTFRKGQSVKLKIEYFQGGSERGLRMGWSTPSQRAKAGEKPKVDNVVETYLPSGADWYDFWTNELHSGGQRVKKAVPLDELPLYVRAGSIVPFSPVMQYATERKNAPYEIRIYPGTSARFAIYEDDNETYDYEKGQFSTFDLEWDDTAKTLTVGKRRGSFPGMVTDRKLNVVLVQQGQGQGQGVEAGKASVQMINYTGNEAEIRF